MEQNKYQGKKYPTNYFLEVYTMCSFKRVIQVYNYLSFFSNLSTSNITYTDLYFKYISFRNM